MLWSLSSEKRNLDVRILHMLIFKVLEGVMICQVCCDELC